MIVLIVDDLATNRLILELLTKRIYEEATIFSLESAKECLDVYDELTISKHEVDLILMDIQMPEQCGDVCADILRRDKGYKGKMYAVTALDEFSGSADVFDDVIFKPISKEKIEKCFEGLE